MANHVTTSEIKKGETVSEHYLSELASVLKAADGKQVLTVAITGPTGVGKSSFLAMLTGDRKIQIGDGITETTMGVNVYGPYGFNDLKQSWGLNCPVGDCQLFFFDTQGFDGHMIGSQAEDRLIIGDLIAPYLAVSNLALLMHDKAYKSVSESFSLFMETAKTIREGKTKGIGGHLEIIDVVNSLAKYMVVEHGERVTRPYEPHINPDSFETASEFVKEITQKKISAQHFFPLPGFSQEELIFDQGPAFKAGFRIVAHRLLGLLDRIQQSHFMDNQGLIDAFECCNKRCKSESLVSFAHTVRNQVEYDAVKRLLGSITDDLFARLYKPNVDQYYSSLTLEMNRRLGSFGCSFDNCSVSDGEKLATILGDCDLVAPEFPPTTYFWKGGKNFEIAIRSKLVKRVPGFDILPKTLSKAAQDFRERLDTYRMVQERNYMAKLEHVQVSYCCCRILKCCESALNEYRRTQRPDIIMRNLNELKETKIESMAERLKMTEPAKITLRTTLESQDRSWTIVQNLSRTWSEPTQAKKCILI